MNLNFRSWPISICVGILLFLSLGAFAKAVDAFDAALDQLLTDTTKAVTSSGTTKVTVLDFTDIEGGMSPFGKFLAEQVSVGLVTAKKGFTIVDRAHLRSILAEHKLTEDGLVKPENAKKLGEFSGVDALVIGTITSVNSGYLVTVKVISTEKAEIVAATKGKLPLNPDFDTTLHTEVSSGGDGARGSQSPSPRQFQSEYFNAALSKIQVLKSGEILVIFELRKNGPHQQVFANLAGFPHSYYVQGGQTERERAVLKLLNAMPTVLRASTGEQYKVCDVNGIALNNSSWQTQSPGISEKQPTVVTLHFRTSEGARTVISATTTFTLDCTMEVLVRDDPDRNYLDKGTVNVHFSDVR